MGLSIEYLETKGTTQADLKTDSTSWENYNNNLWNITNTNLKYSNKDVLLSTGASDTFSKQRIYDFAGNVWEWTLEYTSVSSRPCATRGGAYYSRGSISTVITRTQYSTTYYKDDFGFRVALY